MSGGHALRRDGAANPAAGALGSTADPASPLATPHSARCEVAK